MVVKNERQHGYWGNLTASECAALTEVGDRSIFAAGDTLLAQQDVTRDVVIVWSGLTKVIARVASKQQLILALRGPGDILGEMAHIGGGARSAAVAAINDVVALR